MSTKPVTRYAATRDATWTRQGGGSAGVVKYHIVAEPIKNEMSECGVPVVAVHQGSRECIEASEVALHSRCQRPACRKLWPPIDGVREDGNVR